MLAGLYAQARGGQGKKKMDRCGRKYAKKLARHLDDGSGAGEIPPDGRRAQGGEM